MDASGQPSGKGRDHAPFLAELSCSFFFEAAHRMRSYPEGHPNSRLHGHTYKVEVLVEGRVDDANGFVMPFEDLEKSIQSVRGKIDHSFLNELPGLEDPTSERIARFIWNDLAAALPGLKAVHIGRESIGIRVSYYGKEL